MDANTLQVGDLVKLKVSNAEGMVMVRYPDYKSIPPQFRSTDVWQGGTNQPFFKIELIQGGWVMRTLNGIKSSKRIELDLPEGVHLSN